MPLSPNQLAAHLIRIKAPALAEAVVAEHYRLRPELATRYGEAGRRHCLADAAYHFQFLAAGVEIDDITVFADYVAWAVDLLLRRGIPAGDVAENVRIAGRVVADALPPPLPHVVQPHFEAALVRADRATLPEGRYGDDVSRTASDVTV